MADGSHNHVLSMFNILYNHHKTARSSPNMDTHLIIVTTVHLPSRRRLDGVYRLDGSWDRPGVDVQPNSACGVRHIVLCWPSLCVPPPSGRCRHVQRFNAHTYLWEE